MAEKVSIPWEDINDFVLECGMEHRPYQFCKNVLDTIGELISFDEGMLLMLDGNRRLVKRYAKNIPKSWVKVYLEYYSRMSKGAFALDAELSESRAAPFVRVISWDSYRSQGDFMSDYIQPRGLTQTLAFVLFDLDGSPASCFALDRTRKVPYTERDVQVAGIVSMHLNNLYKNMFVRPEGQMRIWDRYGTEHLTAREREVADLLCEGVSAANIARKLHIAPGTVNKHVGHIYKKLGVNSKHELIVRVLGK